MKRLVSLFVIFAILLSLTGCSEEWRRKFVRKKKEVTKKSATGRRNHQRQHRNSPPFLSSDHYLYLLLSLAHVWTLCPVACAVLELGRKAENNKLKNCKFCEKVAQNGLSPPPATW